MENKSERITFRLTAPHTFCIKHCKFRNRQKVETISKQRRFYKKYEWFGTWS